MAIEKFLHRGFDYGLKIYYLPAKHGIIFFKQQPTTSLVYTKAGDSADSDGIIDCGLMTEKAIQVERNVLGVTSIRIVVEARVHPEMPWTTIINRTYTTTGEEWIVVSERCHQIRVGIYSVGGTPGASDWITVGFNFSR